MYNVYHKYFLFIYIHAYLFVFLTENLINIFRIKICRICFICCNKFSTKKKEKIKFFRSFICYHIFRSIGMILVQRALRADFNV